jgi:hypothetical protein
MTVIDLRWALRDLVIRKRGGLKSTAAFLAYRPKAGPDIRHPLRRACQAACVRVIQTGPGVAHDKARRGSERARPAGRVSNVGFLPSGADQHRMRTMRADLLQSVDDHWRALPEADALRQAQWEVAIYARAGVLDRVFKVRGNSRKNEQKTGASRG